MSFLTSLPQNRYRDDAFSDFAATADFRLGNGKAMAWMSQLAYEAEDPNTFDTLNDVLQSWGFKLVDHGMLANDDVEIVPQVKTRGFVASGRGATIVSFAGTDPVVLANWISDFDAHIGQAQTADGYRRAAAAVANEVKTAIGAPALTNNKIFVTGHSLGGALAALTAQQIASGNQGTAVTAVYTFGMPRPGSADFAATEYDPLLGSCTYRFVQGEDLVPTVAPTEIGFHHVGHLIHCARGSKFDSAALAADSSSDDPQFVAGVAQELSEFLRSPLATAGSAAGQLKLALKLRLGLGPPGARADLAGILIELLPPRLRDHMTDRYIGALSA
jgi:triacylglycerol lipase